MAATVKIEEFTFLQESWQKDERSTSRGFLCLRESAEYSFLSPKSTLRSLFTMLLLLATSYNAIFIPMRSTFPFDTRQNIAFWYTLDYFCDVVYICDIVWRFFVGYYELGVVVTSRKLVVRNYLKRTFVADLLSSLPIDLVHWADPQVHAFLRLNRLIRLIHVPAFFRLREEVSKIPGVLRLVKVCIGVVLLAHWTACGFFAVMKQEAKTNGGVWEGSGPTGWTQGLEVYLNASVAQSYSRCLFWSTCFMTGMGPNPNSPRTEIELYFSFAMLFLGVFVFASIIGNVGDLIANRNATEAKFRKKLDIVNIWMRHKGIKLSLQNRIRNYYQYIWYRQAGLNDKTILEDLPVHLRSDVFADLNRDILRRVSLFEACTDESFLQSLTRKLKPEVYTPNDFIIRQGDFGACMFFITKGIVTVELNGVGKVNTLGENSFFGEIALLMKARRNASIIAKTFVDVFMLTKEDVDAALREYPEFAPEIYRQAREINAGQDNDAQPIDEIDERVAEPGQHLLVASVKRGNNTRMVNPTQWFSTLNTLKDKLPSAAGLSSSELQAVSDSLMAITSRLLLVDAASLAGPSSPGDGAGAARRAGNRGGAAGGRGAGRGRAPVRTDSFPIGQGAELAMPARRGVRGAGTITTVDIELSDQ